MLSWDSMSQSPVFLLLLFSDTSTRQAITVEMVADWRTSTSPPAPSGERFLWTSSTQDLQQLRHTSSFIKKVEEKLKVHPEAAPEV